MGLASFTGNNANVGHDLRCVREVSRRPRDRPVTTCGITDPPRYPSVRNSEGVVLWTHDVGGGFVAAAPEAEAAAGAEIAGGMSGGASTAAATTSEGSEVGAV